MVNFPGFSVVVCAWSTTRNLRGRLASVGLAQARPNKLHRGLFCFHYTTKDFHGLYTTSAMLKYNYMIHKNIGCIRHL